MDTERRGRKGIWTRAVSAAVAGAGTGSLRKSAAQLGMSYSKAYTVIRHAEQELGFALMSKKIGGTGGGGSHLTPQAEELMEKYGRYEQMARRALDALYVEIFEQE